TKGADNAYFPLLIPMSFFEKEASHVEGFSPELAVVTHGGGKELEEAVAIRPTSETIINYYFSKWIQSYRDLPLLLNQWANVVRWEMRPRLFLRTSEFLWQEGHTAHATRSEARKYAETILTDVYRACMVDDLAIPVFAGRKTPRERFAGAINTICVEAQMRDGKALQMGTSHELGQNFSKAFDTMFATADGGRDYVWQTSWGTSTRMVGGLIMCHGDDNGLRVPPNVAPVQVVVMIVREEPDVVAAANRLADDLRALGVRVKVDSQVEQSFGRRAVQWEIKGVPLRMEIGPRDLAEGKAVVARRDLDQKSPELIAGLADRVPGLLAEIQQSMFDQALARRDENTTRVASIADALEVSAAGFGVVPCAVLGETGEDELARSSVTVRCLVTEDLQLPGDEPDEELFAIVGRAY
ncbi:MAG: His/Gly/Thr/Pro-type tRNA ligase C-terminal domain-containing protein, partial [Acidimicrobiales bacterium]